jgi:hypothetical protein
MSSNTLIPVFTVGVVGVAGTPRDDGGSLSWSDHVQLGNRVLRPALVYRADPLVFRVRFAVSNPDLAH